MPQYQIENLKPTIDQDVFIAGSADVIGDVRMKKNSNIWFNCVARGDINYIEIGENTNVQDLTMLHVESTLPLIIGDNVTIGHSVTLHACTIEQGCLIGMGATILDGAVIGKNSLVAAGSLVPPGKVFPEGSFIVGSPAKVKRALTEKEIDQYSNHYKRYIKAKDSFLKTLKKI